MDILSLYELNQLIRSVIEESLAPSYLITAEIASCDVKNHAYLTLIDKDGDTIRAEIRAVIWANRYKVIAPVFEEATGTKLSKGIKVLFQAEVMFHERYGLKLNILSIDPSYTIGELEVRRKEIIDRLSREKLLDRNRSLDFPLVPQKIAIISSPQAAGYEDLVSHLHGNVYGYKFSTRLYEAVMQGDSAESSIVSALNRCTNDSSALDIIVIVRGGGGQTDLHCFDSYEIGKAIAHMPVPVLSGIGHHRDTTIVDLVANRRAKTPTAVADIILEAVRDFEDRIDLLTHDMIRGVRTLTTDAKESLSGLSKSLELATRKELLHNVHRLQTCIKGLRYSARFVKNEKLRLKTREQTIGHLNPRNVLKRGYSLTYCNHDLIKSASFVDPGSCIRTVLYEGELTSTVTGMKKKGRK